ncbi:uncharacterized protein [Primulina huaijiensis]|uniref:uncharacterized protein n=1 Tax=Primulina huaijiensis TaxID=1492673 RepID=UPI003CC76123
MNDVQTTALGSQKRYGRVQGVGGFVKPQVFFKTLRKKRESVPNAMVKNFKEQLEETKSLKVELEKLKAQLASVIPIINDRTSETVTSNKCSDMKDPKLLDDVEEVYECDSSNMKRKKCHLAVKQRETWWRMAQ